MLIGSFAVFLFFVFSLAFTFSQNVVQLHKAVMYIVSTQPDNLRIGL